MDDGRAVGAVTSRLTWVKHFLLHKATLGPSNFSRTTDSANYLFFGQASRPATTLILADANDGATSKTEAGGLKPPRGLLSEICRLGYLSAFNLCRLARVARELWSRRLHRAAQQADAREAGIWMAAQSNPTWSRRRTPQPSVLGLLFLDGYDSSCKP